MALPPFCTEMRNSGIPADEYLQEAFPSHSPSGPRIVVRGDGESHTALRRGIQEFYSVFFSGYTSYLLLDLASLCGVTGRVIPHRDAESRNTRAEISHLGRFLARTSF